MRTIVKRATPNALTQWRRPRLAANRLAGMDCTYDELRRDKQAITAIEDRLYAEQGGICAYTGHHLLPASKDRSTPRGVGFHIEHLKSQQRCRSLDGTVYGEDTDYSNLVACWPPANCGYELPYGAHAKKAWPSSQEERNFVSPLATGCDRRFKFNRRGKPWIRRSIKPESRVSVLEADDP